MREIALTNGGIALVDDADFDALDAFRWQRHKQGYVYRCHRRRPAPAVMLLMHRVVLSAPAGSHVDHKNGNRADNRRENLRLCTRSQNLANRKKQRNNAGSQFKGVTWTRGCKLTPWRARCAAAELGSFATEHEAAEAYNRAALEIYGEFAVPNDIQATKR